MKRSVSYLSLLLLLQSANAADSNLQTISASTPKQAGRTIGQQPAGVTTMPPSFSSPEDHWPLYVQQTPGAPRLSIRILNANAAQVQWTGAPTDFTLQTSTNLAGDFWAVPLEAVTQSGTVNSIVVTRPAVNRFFRLKRSNSGENDHRQPSTERQ